ncbi:helix-turn-helix domain-containing protein [Roseovarius tolerans]|nr:helix-turn-helix domain-containing protein [Roseovarius tolerans]
MAMKMKSIGEVIQEKNIVIKGGDVFTQGGFTQVPNALLRAKGVSQGAKLVYAMLLSYAWHNNSCFPGQDRLADDLSISRQSVNTHIKELERKDYISIKRRGLGKPNTYTLFMTARGLQSTASNK